MQNMTNISNSALVFPDAIHTDVQGHRIIVLRRFGLSVGTQTDEMHRDVNAFSAFQHASP